jgi:DNA-directed RNA polymerase subunit RPC12/RpoP
METKIIRYVLETTGALFMAVAVALLFGIHASIGFELPSDPIFELSLRTVYWVFSGLAFGLAIFCLFSQKASLKAALILWLTVNVMVYTLGLQWGKPNKAFSTYLSCMADAFDIAPGTAWWMAKFICLYLLIGSSMVLLLATRVKSREEKIMAQTFKMVCPACGGRIRFAVENLGQAIPCPLCQAKLTLRKPDLLKMTCFFCKGHIEFPAHAIGEKIPCPHCNMDITLKEQT